MHCVRSLFRCGLSGLLAFVMVANPGLAEEAANATIGIDAELKRAEALPNEEKFEVLGDLLLTHRKRSLGENNGDSTAAFAKTRMKLLQTPGHATHFAFRIRKLRTEALTFPDKYPIYEAYAVRAFGVLELLPSPETVVFVSSFLDDSWNPPFASDAGCPSVNAHRVLGALLRNPPAVERPFDVPAWLSWRKAVSAGDRTFMLKDSDAEYDFNDR